MHRSKVQKQRRKEREIANRQKKNSERKILDIESENNALATYLNESSLAHDIRNFNKDLKSYSEQIEYTLSKHRNVVPQESNDHAISIVALSEMITHRLDVYDFFKNKSNVSTSESPCCFHRIITRVVRVLDNRRRKNRIPRININPSTLEIRCSIKFHSALFAIVENCIKYSPENKEINISINESDTEIELQFNNFGPKLFDDELEHLFKAGGRGRTAEHHYPSEGSGMGMYFVKELCDLHFFKVKMYQDRSNSCYDKGMRFFDTYTEISIPRNL